MVTVVVVVVWLPRRRWVPARRSRRWVMAVMVVVVRLRRRLRPICSVLSGRIRDASWAGQPQRVRLVGRLSATPAVQLLPQPPQLALALVERFLLLESRLTRHLRLVAEGVTPRVLRSSGGGEREASERVKYGAGAGQLKDKTRGRRCGDD